MTDLNIYQRLAAVRAEEEVGYIQKDANVEGYKAISHDQVTSVIRPFLIKHGILTVPRQVESELRSTTKTTRNGTPYTVYIGMYEVDFINIDDPQDKTTVRIGACAEDHGDKGPGKAMSYATKTAYLKVLNIETGESDESREEQKPVTITDEMYITLRELCESKNFPADKTLEKLAKKVFQIRSGDIMKLEQGKFDQAKKFLNDQPAND